MGKSQRAEYVRESSVTDIQWMETEKDVRRHQVVTVNEDQGDEFWK